MCIDLFDILIFPKKSWQRNNRILRVNKNKEEEEKEEIYCIVYSINQKFVKKYFVHLSGISVIYNSNVRYVKFQVNKQMLFDFGFSQADLLCPLMNQTDCGMYACFLYYYIG